MEQQSWFVESWLVIIYMVPLAPSLLWLAWTPSVVLARARKKLPD